MKVFCVKVEYKCPIQGENYIDHTLWSTREGARKALKEKRDAILREPGWSEDSIETDELDRFFAYEDNEYYESYAVVVYEETVHEG